VGNATDRGGRRVVRLALAAGLALGAWAPLGAQDAEVPYWASLTANRVNMRVGPARN
jgi:SH3-like domain-containing protein